MQKQGQNIRQHFPIDRKNTGLKVYPCHTVLQKVSIMYKWIKMEWCIIDHQPVIIKLIDIA